LLRSLGWLNGFDAASAVSAGPVSAAGALFCHSWKFQSNTANISQLATIDMIGVRAR